MEVQRTAICFGALHLHAFLPMQGYKYYRGAAPVLSKHIPFYCCSRIYTFTSHSTPFGLGSHSFDVTYSQTPFGLGSHPFDVSRTGFGYT